MKIAGLLKTSLLDYPGRLCCTVFLKGCNLRCPFCHNGMLLDEPAFEPAYSADSFFSFLEKRKGLLDGVCISGGEPLLHRELGSFLEKIKAMGYLVKLDTNGCYPDHLKILVQAGYVDYIAMDIKNAKNKYNVTTGEKRVDFSKIEESAAFLMKGEIPYEFRTTVVREFHEAEDFKAIGEWLKGARQYFLQGFVDSEGVLKKGLHGYEKEELEDFKKILLPFIPSVKLRGLE